MTRRRFLIGTGILLSNTTAGCLESISIGTDSRRAGDERTYEECALSIIEISDLPEPAEREVRTALEDGVYESEDALVLEDVLDTSASSLRHEGEHFEYYEPVIDTDGPTTLRLTETHPETDDSLTVVNQSDTRRTITLRLERSDETVFRDEFSVDPDGEATVGADTTWRLGVYRVEVETETLSAETEWEVDEFGSGYYLQVGDAEISLDGPEDAVDPNRCTWDEEGNVETRW